MIDLVNIMMNDLIININFKDSLKGGVIIETFSGIIKKIKKKTFSGPLRNIDILYVDKCCNIEDSMLLSIKNIFSEKSTQIAKNRYLFDEKELESIVKILCDVTTIYVKYKDREMYEVEGFVEIKEEPKNFHGKRITIGEREFFCIGNVIYFVKLLNIKKSKLQIFSPVPEMFLDFSPLKITGKLFFSYNGYEIASNSTQETITTIQDDIVYMRNLQEEKKYIDILKSMPWEKSINNTFLYNYVDKSEYVISYLQKRKFRLYTKDNKKILPSSNLSFNVNYGIDWLELDVNYNDKNISRAINFKSKKRYVELDDGVVFLPDIIRNKKYIFNNQNEKIIANKNKIGDFNEIFLDNSIRSNFYERDITELKDIKIDLPQKLNMILRSYQFEGVRWLTYLFQNGLGGCLADDMGLGKTIQAISFLSNKNLFKGNNDKFLIIVPKTLIKNWVYEINKFNSDIVVEIYHGKERENNLFKFKRQGGILISTYNTVLMDIEKIAEINYDCIFLDEVQYIKNSSSKTYLAIQGIKSKSKFALSGTPFENNLGELWSIMNILNADCFGSKNKFMKEYGDINNKEKLEKLNLKIKPFILRRLKRSVLSELPDKTEQTIICSMSAQQEELYKCLKKNIKNEIERMPNRFEIKDASIILEGLLYLRQVCCHPKLLKKEYNINACQESDKFELFKNLVNELQGNKHKVIVFSQFTKMLQIMKRWAERKKYKIFYLDGKTKDRQTIVDEFENSDNGIFFISLKAGGVGLNIVSCQYAIIYDPWWNPAVENQAADRIYRIGQNKNVFIYKLITENSIEEKIQQLQKIKQNVSEELFDNTDKIKKLNYNDLKQLLN